MSASALSHARCSALFSCGSPDEPRPFSAACCARYDRSRSASFSWQLRVVACAWPSWIMRSATSAHLAPTPRGWRHGVISRQSSSRSATALGSQTMRVRGAGSPAAAGRAAGLATLDGMPSLIAFSTSSSVAPSGPPLRFAAACPTPGRVSRQNRVKNGKKHHRSPRQHLQALRGQKHH